ncbi:lipoyl(octanoyl) transferase LipB [Phaeodactylibacter luteus]|uniref:Octanoyltransferase n=1 Tax=Phaeodactylibacter luteus TaxID=1564516 RepID=A0A5C6S771_9BACT|nr:lipoyl(octanoyl) transferase LipB [Phaeodactylibacter luteus]TXB69494.1 lipoyl(octanoyl) transferase LipB [Phaeodactylibacter luteus]
MQQVVFQDLGKIRYAEAWELQEALLKRSVDLKMANRDKAKAGAPLSPQQHFLLFCEHFPVYTLGKSGSPEHLLLDDKALAAEGFEYFKINRGGDITYHGPGQIVGYPILDLDEFFTDIHKYVRYLEEAVIRTLARYGLEGGREDGFTGVWLAPANGKPKRKICAIGVHLKRWVTMHGFAFNVNTDLSHFGNIIPCGIADEDKGVTSMQAELGRELSLDEVKAILKEEIANLFGFNWANGGLDFPNDK